MDKQLFNDLVDSLNEMVAIENGEITPDPGRVHVYALPDVKLIRKNSGLKQAEFAEAIGSSVDLVRSWEQKRRFPSGMALKVLSLIEKQPNLIKDLQSIPA